MTASHPSLAVFGYSQAAMFLRGAQGSEVVGIISIHCTREFAVESDVGRRLDLRFDDVEVPAENDVVGRVEKLQRKLPLRCDFKTAATQQTPALRYSEEPASGPVNSLLNNLAQFRARRSKEPRT